jgi:NADH dehydrogenase
VVHIISGAPFLFQATVVLLEIAIGLALIGGLFTFLAYLASIGLCLMFTLSAQAEPSILWFFFSGILFLGGAGRGTGLDHWVMPWLGNLWSRWGRMVHRRESPKGSLCRHGPGSLSPGHLNS